MRKAVIAVTLGCILFAVGGCNTVKGLGRDVESVGRAGEKAID